MKSFITIRIYFEHGQKVKNQTFWKKLYSADFATELLKRAKALDLHQVLLLNVSKGYFNKQKVNWGISEIQDFKHPNILEIVDTEFKIDLFIKEQKILLSDTQIIMVKNEVLLKN